ncbi:DUF5018 domain-containing protein [Chitinophaga sp. 30R24]|uniref:DUF5018 domain-containing protein n=1 Tax=Chitinophaga sp. 30R24 TaxID=3248838 RepID=UPI003B9077E7
MKLNISAIIRNRRHLIFAALLPIIGWSSCRKADQVARKEQSALSDIYLTIDGRGGERLFDPVYSAHQDTIYFNVPWFYPVSSDNEVDLRRMIVRSTIPTDAIMKPMLGNVMDLSKPLSLTITAGNGQVSQYVVMARKVGDLTVSSAKITFLADGVEQEVEGIIQDNKILFYVLPGLDVSNAKFTYGINKHSTGSIPDSSNINLTQEVPFIVKGVDGASKAYALQVLAPQKLAYGAGINRKLWTKNAADLNFSANNETSLTTSGDYLVLVRRTNPSRYSVINRFTGAYLRDMYNPLPGLSFQIASDSLGRILAASWAPKNSAFILYRYNNVDDVNPVKLVDWTNNNPGGVTADGGVGRRVNIYGDLNKDAVIMATAGQSTVIYKWRVVNGAILSNTPEIVRYNSIAGGAATFWGFYAEAQPISAAPNPDYFINYQYEVALVNGATNTRSAALTLGAPVVFTLPTAYGTFNNAKYLAIVKYLNTMDLNQVQMALFDITNPSKIPMGPSDPSYASFNIFTSDLFTGTTNGNGTADICIGYSENNEKMQVYMLLTNGGIMAREFTTYAP